MNRNFVVGGVIFGLVLAGLSVGISTFMVNRDLQSLRTELAASAVEGGKASSITSSTPAADPKGGAFVTDANGVASNLTVDGFLWSKGRLILTDENDPNKTIFSVETSTGVKVTSDKGFQVDHQSRMGDIASSGKVTVKGLVEASSFETTGAAFVVDKAGVLKASSIQSTGDLSASGRVWAGTETNGFSWDPALGFTIKGALTVNKLVNRDAVAYTHTYQSDRFELTNAQGSWDATDGLKVNKATIGALTVSNDASIAGMVTAGSAKVNGNVAADSLTVIASPGVSELSVDSVQTRVIGTLRVVGDEYVTNLYASGAVSASNLSVESGGLVATGTATFNNNLVVSGLLHGNGGIDSPNVVVANSLNIGPSAPYLFVVDPSGTTVRGTLHVVNNATFDGNETVAGKVTAGAVKVNGNLAAASATVAGNADIGGNGTVAGNLDIAGNIAAANLPNLRHGVGTIGAPGPGTITVNVAAMPAGADVVLTPRFNNPGPYFVTVSAGHFVIDGDAGDYSWIAVW